MNKELFGKIEGKEVYKHTLTGENISLDVLDLGATIQGLYVDGINIVQDYMATEMNTAPINDETRNKEILSRIPAKRWGTPNDGKGVAVFLSSHASDYLSGATIPVDGGYLGR